MVKGSVPDKSHRLEFFQQITAPLIEGVVIIDKQGSIQAVNQAVTALFGYEEKELIGQNVKILMPKKYSKDHDSYIDNYNKTGQAKILDVGREVEGKHKEGSVFSLNLKVNEIRYEDQVFYMGVLHSLEETNQIKKQSELLKRAEEISQIGHWRIDLVDNSVFWSSEIYRIHDVTPDCFDHDLESAIRFYHKDDIDLVRESIEKAIQHNQGFTFEARILRPSGEIRHVRSAGECQVDSIGNLIAIFGVFQDITEQARALKAIEDQNVFLSLIMESIPDFLFVKDEEFRIVSANPAFLNAYPEEMRDKVIGTTTLEAYNEQEAEEFLFYDKQALSEGVSENEETIMFPDGQVRTLVTKKVRFEQDGKKFILGIARDITNIKEAERKLAESEERYELAVSGSSAGLWDWNVKTGALFWSDRFKEIIGISDEDFRPHYEEFSERLHPEDKESTENALLKHLEEGTPYDVEYRLRRTDNSYVWIHARGQAIWDEGGKPSRMAGSVDDISQQKEAEEKLIQANSELEEFSYRTSHDLRSPLVSSITLLMMAKKSIQDGSYELAIQSLEHIEDSLKKLEALVKDILTLTHAKNIEEETEKIEIEELVDESLEKFANLENFERLNITKDLRFKAPLYLKKSRISLIVENLISNAVKYQDTSEKLSYLKISSYKEGHDFVLKVEDNGIGIPKDRQGQIFQMFKRFHSKVSFGSGLGLYMMKKSARILGGDIVFEDCKKGSIFKVIIPIPNEKG